MFWVGCLSVRMYVCSGKGILQQACSQILVLFFALFLHYRQSACVGICFCKDRS